MKLNTKHKTTKVKGNYPFGHYSFCVLCFLFFLSSFCFEFGTCSAQNIGINTSGATPNSKAMLDISGTTGGLLIPRMTTTQRNALAPSATEQSLLIYNITTKCFEAWNNTTSQWVAFGCIGCTVPSAVTASAAPNPICVGSTLTLTGGATDATSWNWTGPNSYTSSAQSPTIAGITTAGAGVYTLSTGNNCGWSAPANTASVSVSAAPTTAAAGTDINPACGVTTATLAGNTPTVGTGLWTVTSGTATITTPTSPTSGVTGLAVPGTATLRWTISNAPCADSFDDVIITTSICCPATVTDVDGNIYNTVFIGTQCWMKENLKTTKYKNGISIPNITANATWISDVDGGYCCYNNDCPTYNSTYGKLYNSYAATNGAGLCPTGWHVPANSEWVILEEYLGMCTGGGAGCSGAGGCRGTNEGGELKEAGTTHWTPSNTCNGTCNTSGFTALPGGYRTHDDGLFYSIGSYGFFLRGSQYGYVSNTASNICISSIFLRYGMSVRCVKD